MADKLFRESDKTDPYLQRVQRVWDRLNFDRDYCPLNIRDNKIRHIGEHVGKAAVKIIGLRREKASNSAIRDKLVTVVPDLLMYRTQLANELRVPNLSEIIGNLDIRGQGLRDAAELVSHARGLIDWYTQDLEHGSRPTPEARRNLVDITIPELHMAAVGLAQRFELGSPANLHHAYLEQKHIAAS